MKAVVTFTLFDRSERKARGKKWRKVILQCRGKLGDHTLRISTSNSDMLRGKE